MLTKEVQEGHNADPAASVFVGLGVGILVMMALVAAVICCDIVGTTTAAVDAANAITFVESPKAFVFLPPGIWTYPESNQCAYDSDNSHRVLLIAGETCERWAMEHPYNCSVNLEWRYAQYANDLFVAASSDGPRIFFADDATAPQAVTAQVDCD